MSLDEYVARCPPEQKEIYFLCAPSRDLAVQSPYLEAFEKAGLEVTHLVPQFIPFSTDSRLPQHPLLVKAYLKMPFVWRFLGGQFVIVGKKALA